MHLKSSVSLPNVCHRVISKMFILQRHATGAVFTTYGISVAVCSNNIGVKQNYFVFVSTQKGIMIAEVP